MTKKEEAEQGSYEFTGETFDHLEALVADARGNSLFGAERQRLLIGAGYLQLAAQTAAALAEFVTAVANGDLPRCKKARKRLAETDREVLKLLDKVDADNARRVAEGKSVVVEGEEAQKLLQMALQNEDGKVQRRTLQTALLHSVKSDGGH